MTPSSKNIAIWLYTCAAAVFLMALIGAITRLTESGLSIVEWKPVTGALPPLDETSWNRAFESYKTSPQYSQVNLGMSLEDFKQIYFWEWLHRLWGRLIGLIYFVPLVYFRMKRQIPDNAKKPLLGILALGFLQGALGWFMVKSGLVDQPAVSHYRLAAHLMLAFVIFCALLRMGLVFSAPAGKDAGVPRMSIKAITVLAGLTMVWGAFVAGLRAGKLYPAFSMMGEHLWPTEIFDVSPLWLNFFENPAAVQFTHRVLAVLTFFAVLFVVGKSFAAPLSVRLRRWMAVLGVMICVQAGLGIATLLSGVNIIAATLHQAGALIVLAVLMALLHEIPKKG